MPETFSTQISELASRASSSAMLEEAATLRMRGNRRIWRRRGGGALLGTATVAAVISLGLTMTGSSTNTQATATAHTSSSQTSPPTSSAPTPTPQVSVSVPPLPTSRGTLSATAWAHKVQIYDQLQNVNLFDVGDSTYAVITKSTDYDYEVKFYVGAHGGTDVNGFGATWAQVIQGYLERGFTDVTIRTQAGSTLPTDAVIDVQNSAGVSVLGQRIPLTTPIVLVTAG
jgi:hypothetical protein